MQTTWGKANETLILQKKKCKPCGKQSGRGDLTWERAHQLNFQGQTVRSERIYTGDII